MTHVDCEAAFRRMHPLYRKNRFIWERTRDAYAGGAEYIQKALIKHISEIDLEYEERLRRACYFNYPRKLARLITQFVLSSDAVRSGADPALVEDFSRDGMRTVEVMRQFSTMLNLYGAAALWVEMPFFDGEVDLARKSVERLRPAVRALSPLEVVDWGEGDDGFLNWVIIEEQDLLDAGPLLPAVNVRRRKLWTRDHYYILEQDSVTGRIAMPASGRNPLGQVPIVLAAEPDGFRMGNGHYFEDVVRISDAILNNQSESQMNLVKQMFGLLIISDSFARGARRDPAENTSSSGSRFSHVLARSAALWESPEERGISRYISPSGTDTAAIREENQMLKRELYDLVGMAWAPELRHAQTAESKSWDFHAVRQFLASRVDLLEQTEMKAWKIMHGMDPSVPVPEVVYNRDFSIPDLHSSVEALLGLKELCPLPGFRQELAETALTLLEKVRKIPAEARERIRQEIRGGEHV
ncbi:MAG: hypothetical protein IKD46_10795 [Lentisphaeria bacterium]|nr:hypothetical protein [Lentisphaeria bacterium]